MACLTCDMVANRDAGAAPLWDNIHRTAYWDVVHSYNTSLPGWLVLVVRRHIEALDALTLAEAREMGELIRAVSAALRAVVGCQKTYVMQFAEAAEHPHVHVHIVPRMPNQPDDRRGPKVIGYLGVPEAERVGAAAMTDMAVKIRQVLQASTVG